MTDQDNAAYQSPWRTSDQPVVSAQKQHKNHRAEKTIPAEKAGPLRRAVSSGDRLVAQQVFRNSMVRTDRVHSKRIVLIVEVFGCKPKGSGSMLPGGWLLKRIELFERCRFFPLPPADCGNGLKQLRLIFDRWRLGPKGSGWYGIKAAGCSGFSSLLCLLFIPIKYALRH